MSVNDSFASPAEERIFMPLRSPTLEIGRFELAIWLPLWVTKASTFKPFISPFTRNILA